MKLDKIIKSLDELTEAEIQDLQFHLNNRIEINTSLLGPPTVIYQSSWDYTNERWAVSEHVVFINSKCDPADIDYCGWIDKKGNYFGTMSASTSIKDLVQEKIKETKKALKDCQEQLDYLLTKPLEQFILNNG